MRKPTEYASDQRQLVDQGSVRRRIIKRTGYQAISGSYRGSHRGVCKNYRKDAEAVWIGRQSLEYS
jgi:hypothetical protein